MYEELQHAKDNNAYKVEYHQVDVDTQTIKEDLSQTKIDVYINACGLPCFGPVLETFKALETAKNGEVFEIRVSDIGYATDIKQCTVIKQVINYWL
jgi:TusA-related sulfurtransferase